MNIEVINEENNDVFEQLVSGVREYNRQVLGNEKPEPLSVIIRNDDNKIIAGVSGRTIYKHFLINILWSDESVRGKGLGTRVMQQAETEAKKRGCIAAQVDTLSVQAPGFYQKLGFEVVGKVSGLTEDHDRYFLMKEY